MKAKILRVVFTTSAAIFMVCLILLALNFKWFWVEPLAMVAASFAYPIMILGGKYLNATN